MKDKNNSRNIAKALISKLYAEREQHKAADPNSKASARYDEVLTTLQEKGYDKEKRNRRISVKVFNGMLLMSNGNWLLRRKILHVPESN